MKTINKENLTKIVGNAPLDPAVGIQITLLWEDLNKAYYVACIAPNKKITPHFHNEGDELYFIFKGNGIMRLGIPLSTGVEWQQEFEVGSGDFFTVSPKTVHQLENRSDDNLLAIFGCEKSHLNTDRIVINL